MCMCLPDSDTHFPLLARPTHNSLSLSLCPSLSLSQTGLVRWRAGLGAEEEVKGGGGGKERGSVQVLLEAAAALLPGSIKGNYCWW